jgi:hypothetical protein
MPYRSPDRRREIQSGVREIQNDGSSSRASYRFAEQRLKTVSWIRARRDDGSALKTTDRDSNRFGGRSRRKREGRAEARPKETMAFSTTMSRSTPEGVADAARMVVVGRPQIEGGSRSSEPCPSLGVDRGEPALDVPHVGHPVAQMTGDLTPG